MCFEFIKMPPTPSLPSISDKVSFEANSYEMTGMMQKPESYMEQGDQTLIDSRDRLYRNTELR